MVKAIVKGEVWGLGMILYNIDPWKFIKKKIKFKRCLYQRKEEANKQFGCWGEFGFIFWGSRGSAFMSFLFYMNES